MHGDRGLEERETGWKRRRPDRIARQSEELLPRGKPDGDDKTRSRQRPVARA